VRRITTPQARRIALAAQGFADPRPAGKVTLRHLRKVIDRVGVVQLDSVNVVARAHYLPFFARLGNYPMAMLDRLAWGSGEMIEYWAHEAALIPIEQWPLFRHRMMKNSMDSWVAANEEGIAEVLADIRRRGPLRPADFDSHHNSERGPWWDWSDAKLALESLYFTGHLTIPKRVNFARYYDLSERVLPAEIISRQIDEVDQRRQLLGRAVRHHGIGTVSDLADYYRMKIQPSASILAEMAKAGEVEEVEVLGWKEPVYLDPEARLPRSVRGVALLCPFDPLVWYRPRTERLWDFHYRIEIYTPPQKRIYGYYVFPVLLDGELVGRIDLKADRQRGSLLVRASYVEEGQDPGRVAPRLIPDLRTMAAWLGLGEVVVEPRGNLATDLARASASGAGPN
jgi:uncharacterized protein YcaQ